MTRPLPPAAALYASLALAAVLLALASLALGETSLPLNRLWPALTGGGDEGARLIVFDIRLPRALAAFMAGAALGAAGAAMQGLLRNPLADPGVLGVSSAAALGAVLALSVSAAAWKGLAAELGAGLGALAAVAALYLLGAGRAGPLRLILVGVGLSSFAAALLALVMNLAPDPFALAELVRWLLGSVENRDADDLARALPAFLAGIGLLFAAAPGLRALTLGEEAAAALGAHLGRLSFLVVLGAALAVASAVALAGAVGFVGVVAPHLVRPLLRHDPGRLILPAALTGGLLLAAADLAVRLLPFRHELALGVAAALFGAPAFALIAARSRSLDA